MYNTHRLGLNLDETYPDRIIDISKQRLDESLLIRSPDRHKCCVLWGTFIVGIVPSSLEEKKYLEC